MVNSFPSWYLASFSVKSSLILSIKLMYSLGFGLSSLTCEIFKDWLLTWLSSGFSVTSECFFRSDNYFYKVYLLTFTYLIYCFNLMFYLAISSSCLLVNFYISPLSWLTAYFASDFILPQSLLNPIIYLLISSYFFVYLILSISICSIFSFKFLIYSFSLPFVFSTLLSNPFDVLSLNGLLWLGLRSVVSIC